MKKNSLLCIILIFLSACEVDTLKSDSGTESSTTTGVDAGSQIETDAGSQIETDAGSQIETDAGSQIETDAGSQIETDAGSQIETDAGDIQNVNPEYSCHQFSEITDLTGNEQVGFDRELETGYYLKFATVNVWDNPQVNVQIKLINETNNFPTGTYEIGHDGTIPELTLSQASQEPITIHFKTYDEGPVYRVATIRSGTLNLFESEGRLTAHITGSVVTDLVFNHVVYGQNNSYNCPEEYQVDINIDVELEQR